MLVPPVKHIDLVFMWNLMVLLILQLLVVMPLQRLQPLLPLLKRKRSRSQVVVGTIKPDQNVRDHFEHLI